MVKRSRVIRADRDYFDLKAMVSKNTGERFTDPEFTRGISRFLIEEDLVPIMVRRVKRNKPAKRRGWFS